MNHNICWHSSISFSWWIDKSGMLPRDCATIPQWHSFYKCLSKPSYQWAQFNISLSWMQNGSICAWMLWLFRSKPSLHRLQLSVKNLFLCWPWGEGVTSVCQYYQGGLPKINQHCGKNDWFCVDLKAQNPHQERKPPIRKLPSLHSFIPSKWGNKWTW